MSHVYEGPLAAYNSLLDPHLAGYFSNTHIRKHLKRSKLITRRGEVITESGYRLLNARAEHRKQVKEMLAQSIVNKAIELERQRQADVRRQLEITEKIKMVKRVRAERKFGYEDTIMDLLRPASAVRRDRLFVGERASSLPKLPRDQSSLSSNQRQSHSAGSRRQAPSDEHDDYPYIDDRAHSRERSASQESGNRKHTSPRSERSHDRRSEASSSGKRSNKTSSEVEESHYDHGPKPPLSWKPKPPPKKPHPKTPRDEHGRPLKTKKHVRGRITLHRQEPAFKHEREVQTFCEVTLKYLGGTKSAHLQQEVMVEQQHCGGNTLTVFREYVQPKAKITFTSKRHRGFPFGLTLYIDGKMDSTVSTCCEYRHKKGALLGSKTSHFMFIKVTGAKPCYKCEVEAELQEKSKKPGKQDRKKENEAAEDSIEKSEENDDNGSYVETAEKEDENNDGTKKDDYYDDDFEGDSPEKSSSKKDGSSDSESESDRDEDATAREVKGYDDELEQLAHAPKSPSSSKTSKEKSKKLSGEPPVQVAVGDSDDEEGSGTSRSSSVMSRHSDKSNTSEVQDSKLQKGVEEDRGSPTSDRSDRSIRSTQSAASVKSEESQKSASSKESSTSQSSVKSVKSVSSSSSASSAKSKRSSGSASSASSTRSKRSSGSSSSTIKQEADESDKPVHNEESLPNKHNEPARTRSESESSEQPDESQHGSAKPDDDEESLPSKDSEPERTRSESESSEQSDESEGASVVTCERMGKQISYNGEPSVTFEDFLSMIKDNGSLTSLTLRKCEITDLELKELANALVASACPLMDLDLSYNNFGLSGGMELVAALIPDKIDSLERLILSGSPITQLTAAEILSSLAKYSVRIKVLHLDGCLLDNELASENFIDSLTMLISQKNLTDLAISRVLASGIKKITCCISEHNHDMHYLEFSDCGLNEAISAVSCPIQLSGVSVTCLSLKGNNITEKQRDVVWRNLQKGDARVHKLYISDEFAKVENGSTELSTIQAAKEHLDSRSSTPVTSKPPMHPSRRGSLLSSKGASSDEDVPPPYVRSGSRNDYSSDEVSLESDHHSKE